MKTSTNPLRGSAKALKMVDSLKFAVGMVAALDDIDPSKELRIVAVVASGLGTYIDAHYMFNTDTATKLAAAFYITVLKEDFPKEYYDSDPTGRLVSIMALFATFDFSMEKHPEQITELVKTVHMADAEIGKLTKEETDKLRSDAEEDGLI